MTDLMSFNGNNYYSVSYVVRQESKHDKLMLELTGKILEQREEIKHLQAEIKALKDDHWIPCSDRLPEEGEYDQNGYVFVKIGDFITGKDRYDSGDGILAGKWQIFGNTVTHWMEISPTTGTR